MRERSGHCARVLFFLLISSVSAQAGPSRVHCGISLPGQIKRSLELKSGEREKRIYLGENRKALSAIPFLGEGSAPGWTSGLMLKVTRNPAQSRLQKAASGMDRFQVELYSRIRAAGLKGERTVSHARTEVLSRMMPDFALRPAVEEAKFLQDASLYYVSCEARRIP